MKRFSERISAKLENVYVYSTVSKSKYLSSRYSLKGILFDQNKYII